MDGNKLAKTEVRRNRVWIEACVLCHHLQIVIHKKLYTDKHNEMQLSEVNQVDNKCH